VNASCFYMLPTCLSTCTSLYHYLRLFISSQLCTNRPPVLCRNRRL